mgnify:CR=1 FL=1
MNLAGFIIKRVVFSLPLLFFLPLVTFLFMHLAPGNFFDTMRLNPQISPETIAHYEKLYHLDQPVLIQYLHWMKSILHLDFGYSFAYRQPVLTLLLSRLWNTFLLTFTAFLLSWLLAVPLGLWSGMKEGRKSDFLASTAAYAGLSMPNFLLCILLLWFAAATGWLPLGGLVSLDYEELGPVKKAADRVLHMIIPVFVLTLSSFAYLFRLMRAQTRQVSRQDFVFFLHARHIPTGKIVYKHIGRNAINPMLSLFGLELPALFSGAALVEIFTGWPGLGSMMLAAVRAQDLFLVLGNMLMIAFLLVAGNLIADIMIVAADPRVRLGAGGHE